MPFMAKFAENNFVMGSFCVFCEYPPFEAVGCLLESKEQRRAR